MADPPTDAALFTIALTSDDDEARWEAIHQLQSRASAEVCAEALRLCGGDAPAERAVGAHVLAQLGLPAPTYHEVAVLRLLAMLEHEADPEVLVAIGFALGHRNDARAVAPMLRHLDHPDDDVRDGVRSALSCQDHPAAITGLIVLSADRNSDIRDWATFGLGSLCAVDTPELRAALVERLGDPDPDTRGEAIVGLARRGDRRALPALLEDLAGGGGTLTCEAAELFADPQLLPALLALREDWADAEDYKRNALEEAIAACAGGAA